MYILHLLKSLLGLSLLEMLVNLSQYRGSVGIFNNRDFFVQSKFSHFSYLSDNSNNDNTNLAIGLLFLLNKIALVLLLLNLMFVFKDNGFKHKKSPLFAPFFPYLSHVTCFVVCISFWSHSEGMLNKTLVLNAKLHRPF